MARLNRNKLNSILTGTSSGVVIPTSWLRQQGVSSKLTWWYVHSGWLERVGVNAYCKKGEEISWAGVVYCLEQLMQLSVHVGGKTALILLGRAHFVPLAGLHKIFLFTQPKVRVPIWINKSEKWNEEFLIIKKNLFDKNSTTGIVERKVENLIIKLSSPERAIIEVMHLVPKQQTYEEARLLMENLTNLRSAVVQELLEQCKSIKAKRLFLHCAEKCNHQWLEEIDLSCIDLGKGKRKIGEGGVYDPKYFLSVPKIKSE